MSLNRQVIAKMKSKRNPALDAEAQEWIESVLEESFPSERSYEDALQDGILLCKLMNKLQPGSVPRIKTSGGAFAARDNISQFQMAAKRYGLPDTDLFQSVDLYDKHNIAQVTTTIYAVGRYAQKNGFMGPMLGPKMADENKRDFTEAQLRGGESTIGLQAGYNKGATQKGLAFGMTRHM